MKNLTISSLLLIPYFLLFFTTINASRQIEPIEEIGCWEQFLQKPGTTALLKSMAIYDMTPNAQTRQKQKEQEKALNNLKEVYKEFELPKKIRKERQQLRRHALYVPEPENFDGEHFNDYKTDKSHNDFDNSLPETLQPKKDKKQNLPKNNKQQKKLHKHRNFSQLPIIQEESQQENNSDKKDLQIIRPKPIKLAPQAPVISIISSLSGIKNYSDEIIDSLIPVQNYEHATESIARSVAFAVLNEAQSPSKDLNFSENLFIPKKGIINKENERSLQQTNKLSFNGDGTNSDILKSWEHTLNVQAPEFIPGRKKFNA